MGLPTARFLFGDLVLCYVHRVLFCRLRLAWMQPCRTRAYLKCGGERVEEYFDDEILFNCPTFPTIIISKFSSFNFLVRLSSVSAERNDILAVSQALDKMFSCVSEDRTGIETYIS